MEREVKVPDFMLTASAAYGPLSTCEIHREDRRKIIEAALRALMENPIVPTMRDANEMLAERVKLGHLSSEEAAQIPLTTIIRVCEQWQRRMFLAPTDPRRDKIRRILHTFGILSEDEKIDAILSAFEQEAEK